jgi:hypothetical protein
MFHAAEAGSESSSRFLPIDSYEKQSHGLEELVSGANLMIMDNPRHDQLPFEKPNSITVSDASPPYYPESLVWGV